jgi:hypothetical protein
MYALKQQNISTAPGPLHVSLTKQINMKSSFGSIREQCHLRGRVPQKKETLTCAQKRVYSAASTAGAPTVSSIDENGVLDAVIVGAGISGLTTALVCCDMLKVIWIGWTLSFHVSS